MIGPFHNNLFLHKTGSMFSSSISKKKKKEWKSERVKDLSVCFRCSKFLCCSHGKVVVETLSDRSKASQEIDSRRHQPNQKIVYPMRGCQCNTRRMFKLRRWGLCEVDAILFSSPRERRMWKCIFNVCIESWGSPLLGRCLQRCTSFWRRARMEEICEDIDKSFLPFYSECVTLDHSVKVGVLQYNLKMLGSIFIQVLFLVIRDSWFVYQKKVKRGVWPH